MNVPNIARGLLQLRLALVRLGVGALLGGALLFAAAVLWLVLLPGLAVRIDARAQAVQQARSAPPPKPVVSAPALASARLTAFYAALGDGAHTEQVVVHLFDAASDAGVTLDKAEYKPAHDAAGRFDTYTVVLPVKGDYASLRHFSERVLSSVPYASLDDMRFKRNSASDPAVEASLRFTAYLRPAVWVPAAAPTLASASVPVTDSAALTSTPSSALAPASASASRLAPTSTSAPTSTPPRAALPFPMPTLPLPTSFAQPSIPVHGPQTSVLPIRMQSVVNEVVR